MSYWESDPLVYALNAEGALVHVDTVANGSACACSCPSCKQPLVAKNAGSVLIQHFAHQRGTCKWAVEAAVIRMVRDILKRKGAMRVEGAGYYDACEGRWYYFSPAGRLAVSQVSDLAVDGRYAPALVVSCIDEHDMDCEFVLVAELARRVSAEQIERFREEERNVLAIGLRDAYVSMRDAEGRHFSRREFLLRVQERSFLESALMDREGSEALKWLVHPRRDAVESEADERYRKKCEEESKARMLEFQQRMEQIRLEAEFERIIEEERRAEEERKKAELREQLIDAERRAFELEGVEALPKTKHGVNFYVDECPLLGEADVVADCGGYAWSPDRCIFFEGQRCYFIGCTARQNGVGLED